MLALRLLTVTAGVMALVATSGSSRAAREAAPVRAAAVAAGLAHTCVLTTGGAVRCWGYNGHDELGFDGQDSRSPIGVPGLSDGVTAIAAGVRHSCAITRAGGATCWGYFRNGALGDGVQARHYTRVDVTGLGSGVAAVAAGNDDSCALTTSGGVKCWGYNTRGQLGDGTTTDRWAPVDVVGLTSGVKAIAAGPGFIRTCALTSGGGVKCWGGDHLTPVDVAGLSSGVTTITAGCALTSSGGVKCWGKDLQPVDVPGLTSGVSAIATSFHSCALLVTGGVRCWGLNDHGQLGDGTRTDHSTPADVVGLHGPAVAISAGSFHTCAVLRSGGVDCWGSDGTQELRDGTYVDHLRPVAVAGFVSPKATLAVVSRSVAVTPARMAAVRVRCGPAARCRGTLKLVAARLTLGSRTFSIPAGAAQAIPVRLAPRTFALLVRAKRLSTRVTVTGEVATARQITLVAPS